jgi:hypothetical protein
MCTKSLINSSTDFISNRDIVELENWIHRICWIKFQLCSNCYTDLLDAGWLPQFFFGLTRLQVLYIVLFFSTKMLFFVIIA